MHKVTTLADYSDDDGNVIESPTVFDKKITITLRGKNNRIIVDPKAKIKELIAVFDCDNGLLTIGPNAKHGFSMSIRVGQDSKVIIGADVTTTTRCIVSAVEGSTVEFGHDVMIASQNQFRGDDGHPIFDVHTGKRVNPAKDIRIGNHVWMGAQSVAIGGANVGDGSVIGFGSLVTGTIPNNCIAVGTPARMVRKDIAWERPHLSFVAPRYKPDSSTVDVSEQYWATTDVPEPGITAEPTTASAKETDSVEAGTNTGERTGFVARVLRRFGYAKVS